MRIKEVITKSGLSKKTIHYYIQTGLLCPKQADNGYYDFSDSDLTRLETIKKMRYLGLSVETIRDVFEDPSVAFYYFIKHQKSLQKELKELEWKNKSISAVLEDLNTGTDYDVLAKSLSAVAEYCPEESLSRAVDMSDAELLAYFFWGRYVGKTALTEYQKFLWEKLKKTIVLTQNEFTCRLRDSLYQFQKDNVSEEFYDYCDVKISAEISSLSEDDCPRFADYMLQRARLHLGDPAWVCDWKRNQRYLIDTGYFFDSEASVIMCEMSPFFERYKRNINRCGKLLEEYAKTDKGKDVIDSIHSILSPDLDLYAHNNATLIGICLWH